MSNKGYLFEVSSVDFYRNLFAEHFPNSTQAISGSIYRVGGSGRSKLATKTGAQDTILEGDVIVDLGKFFHNCSFVVSYPSTPFIGVMQEDKHYKSKSVKKSFSIKKEWLDQCRDEATNNHMLPVLAIKFKGVHPTSNDLKKYSWYGEDGNSVHYIVPEKHWKDLWSFILTLIEDRSIAMTPIADIDLSRVPAADLIAELGKRVK